MNRLFTVCSVLLCLILSIPGLAQKKYPNTLLWRISGKGLQKPSYLYGTMHLTDKRIFQFGDSVYQAIERCDGLAIELNPDEMAAWMVNQAINEAESKNLSDILDRKEYARYSAGLAKKFKKPAEEVTTADVVKEKNRWITEFLEKGEMPTFVDGWLYSFARKQGKWVGGVEDMADQSGLMEDLVDGSDIDYLLAGDSTVKQTTTESMNSFIDLYLNQDLEQIDNVMNTDFGRSRDKLLIKRNVKMARRIDSLMSFRTMFIAVGAAHLPGDSGVIDLLKARGFSVDPVFSKKKIDAQTYPVKTVNIPWQSYEDGARLYSVSMPGNPATVKLYNMIEMKFFLDMGNMSAYCTMAAINTTSNTNKDSMMMGLARNMLKQQKVAPPKKVMLDGLEGSEFVKNEKGENVRIQVFTFNKVVYIAFMYSLKKEGLTTPDANKFFSSLVIKKTAPETVQSVQFTDSVMGISFLSPVKLEVNSKLSAENSNNWKVTAYNGSHQALGAYIMLFSKEVVAGYHLPGDSLVQADILERMGTLSNGIKHQYKVIQGVKGLEYIGQNKEQPGVYYRAMSFIRNNRNIQFLVVCDSSQLYAPAIEQLFTSLRFITPEVKWSMHPTPDHNLSAWAPAPFQTVLMNGVYSFAAYDTTTAISYLVTADTLSKYTWHNTDSSFWQNVRKYTTNGMVVKDESEIKLGLLTGKDLTMHADDDSTIYQKLRLVLVDSILYKVTVNGKKELIDHPNTNRFLKEVVVQKKPSLDRFYTTPKGKMILADLASGDSATRRSAWQYFTPAPFEKKDIPMLHDHLFRFFYSPYYGSDTATMINNAIAEKLVELKDSTAVDFVRKQYPLLTGNKDMLKDAALTLLAAMHTRESYNLLASLIQDRPVTGVHYAVYNSMYDSLALTNTIYPSLEKLVKDTSEVSSIASITVTLRDSGLLSREALARYESDFLQAATQLLSRLKKSDLYGGVNDVVKVVGGFKTAAAINVLKSYLTVKDNYVLLEVVNQLLQNKQLVPAAALNKLAADKMYRIDLYTTLKSLKRTDLFPKQYLTQAQFAAAAIHNASNDDYPADKITLLSTKTALYRGKKYLFYLYKVVFESDEEAQTYLGIAGGYSGTGVEVAEELTSVLWAKAFDAKTVNADFAAFIKAQTTP